MMKPIWHVCDIVLKRRGLLARVLMLTYLSACSGMFNGYFGKDENKITQLITKSGDQRVMLTWTVAQVVTGTTYNVKRSEAVDGTFSVIAQGLAETNYLDTQVTNGTTYYYAIDVVSPNKVATTEKAEATPRPLALGISSPSRAYVNAT